MATWNRKEVLIRLPDVTSGGNDTTLRTVEVYPMDNSYPTGKINCSQLASLYDYQPDSDLDDETHYWIRWTVGATTYEVPLWAKKSYPSIGA